MGINIQAVALYAEKCGVKSILQTKPIAIKELNLAGLKSLSKGHLTPFSKESEITANYSKAFLSPKSTNLGICQKNSKVENLKKLCNEKEIPFLMHDEIWSSKKADEVIDKLYEEIKIMKKNGGFNKENLQANVNKLIPKSNIEIKNFSELKADLEKWGFSPEEIEYYLSCEGSAFSNPTKSWIYLNFEMINSKNKEDVAELIDTSLHEIRHAINHQKSNTLRLNNDTHPQKDFLGTFCINFFDFVQPFEPLLGQVEKINSETFTKWHSIGYRLPNKVGGIKNISTLEDLHSNFKKAFEYFCKQENYVLPEDINERKKVLKFMKLWANDEAKAYKSTKTLRDSFADPSKPTTMEFRIMQYEELQKFLHKEMMDTCFNKKIN